MTDPTIPPAAARCEFPRPADLMRDADRWAKTNADAVTDGSRAQVIYCIRDAQHDIAELTREVRMWRTIGSLPQPSPRATHAAALRVVEAARNMAGSYTRPNADPDLILRMLREVDAALAAFDAAQGGNHG
jgi:hypothetical protein